MAFEARFVGICPSCENRIRIGEKIESSEEGYRHVMCEEKSHIQHPVCTTCFLVHPPGTCDRE